MYSTVEAIQSVSERFCKGHHYKDVELTDAMVTEICKVKSLVNMGFINTKITDKALADLSTLPKLEYLFIEDNQNFTGEGFIHFWQHPKLEHISVNNTMVNDKTLETILKIPKLKSISLKNTKVTFDGLMAVAHYKKVKFYLNENFSPEEIKAFEQAQRNAGKRKLEINKNDFEETQKLLLDFFKAMTQWENFASISKINDNEVKSQCEDIFKRFCTEKPRTGRPEAISYSGMPKGTYGNHQIIDSEQITKNKFYLYTQDDYSQYRFLFIRKNGIWKIDEAQSNFGGGWKKYGL